jgi:hypothetical protein
VGIRATDEDFLGSLRRHLGRFLLDEKPESFVLFSADCGLKKTLPGGKQISGKNTLYINMLPVFNGRDQGEMAGRFVGLVRDMTTDHSNQFLRIRAAGIVPNGGGALLLPSPPQPHLASLAALLVRAGGSYLGDELVAIDPVLGQAHPLTLPMLVASGDLALFPELDRNPPRRRAADSDDLRGPRCLVSLDELGGEAARSAAVDRIVFPTFIEGGVTEIQPMSRSEALFGLTGAVLNMHVWNERALLLLRRILEGAKIERLLVGSLPEAVELLMQEQAN